MFFVLYKILFYLNRFINPYFNGNHSAIKRKLEESEEYLSRNPYFNGTISAIPTSCLYTLCQEMLQSLFYWKYSF